MAIYLILLEFNLIKCSCIYCLLVSNLIYKQLLLLAPESSLVPYRFDCYINRSTQVESMLLSSFVIAYTCAFSGGLAGVFRVSLTPFFKRAHAGKVIKVATCGNQVRTAVIGPRTVLSVNFCVGKGIFIVIGTTSVLCIGKAMRPKSAMVMTDSEDNIKTNIGSTNPQVVIRQEQKRREATQHAESREAQLTREGLMGCQAKNIQNKKEQNGRRFDVPCQAITNSIAAKRRLFLSDCYLTRSEYMSINFLRNPNFIVPADTCSPRANQLYPFVYPGQ